MRASFLWLGALTTGVIAWAAAPELAWPARLLAAILIGPAPALFILQAQAVQSLPGPLPRVPVYLGSITALWLLALLALAAGSTSGLSPGMMGLRPLPAGSFIGWTLVATAASGATVALFKALGLTEAAIMREIAPVTRVEKAVFVLLSVSAGVCEELTFRGFLLPALSAATGSLVAGVVVSSLAFGLLHAHQGAAGALRAAVLGAVLAVPLVVTASVVPSMVAHTAIDIAGGLWLARWLFR